MGQETILIHYSLFFLTPLNHPLTKNWHTPLIQQFSTHTLHLASIMKKLLLSQTLSPHIHFIFNHVKVNFTHSPTSHSLYFQPWRPFLQFHYILQTKATIFFAHTHFCTLTFSHTPTERTTSTQRGHCQ